VNCGVNRRNAHRYEDITIPIQRTFCEAIDTSGDVVSYNGHAWSKPLLVDKLAYQFASVSCPTTAFCEATDTSGHTWAYRSGKWATGSQLGTPPTSLIALSCPATTFCLALNQQGSVFTYTGGTWSAPHSIDPAGDFAGADCFSPAFCAAVGVDGDAQIGT
jgi:hypothetical protein